MLSQLKKVASQFRNNSRKAFRSMSALGVTRGLAFHLKSEFGDRGREISVVLRDVRHPILMSRKTAEAWMFTTVFVNKEYEFSMDVKPRIIVDLGAHVGMASIYFANRYPDARILAIEPSPRNFSRLMQNTRHYSSITPINAAIWSSSGSLTIVNPNDHSSAYQMRPLHINEDEEAEVIRAMTMDEVLSIEGFNHIDLLKIDIEGSELALFGANVDWLKHVNVIAIELHDRFAPGCKNVVQGSFAANDLRWRSKQIGETTVYMLS